MSKNKKATIEVQGTAVTILSQKEEDYLSLTDIARYKNDDRTDDLVRNRLRNRNTIEFLGVWERLNNPGRLMRGNWWYPLRGTGILPRATPDAPHKPPGFNPVEFDGIRMQAGLNSFSLTAKQWIEKRLAPWASCPSRSLRRNMRLQGHRFRVRLLDIRRVQAANDRGGCAGMPRRDLGGRASRRAGTRKRLGRCLAFPTDGSERR